MLHQSYFSTSLNDFSDIFNTDLFAHDLVNGTLNANNANSPATASSSRASSPQSPFQSSLLTPPQGPPPTAFPEYNPPSSFFNFLDDDSSKQLDPMSINMSSTPYDFIGAFGVDAGMGIDINMDMHDFNSNPMTFVGDTMGIDPQLVGTPSALSEIAEEDEHDHEHRDIDADADVSASPSVSSAASSPAVAKPTTSKARNSKKTKEKEKEAEQERERLTLVIQPVKVGGHGKARKGTVQSGGVVKRSTSSASSVILEKDKENTGAPSVPPPSYTLPSAFTPTNLYPSKAAGKAASESGKDKDEDDDDLPQDWRPSPEVFQKMTSKEKRQLRNKIKYISTLEGDIAERDRLLDAIRSELGSTQSENYALRQEIAALKRTLLDGRGISPGTPTEPLPLLNLPPPAPLPAQSAAASLALAQQQQLLATATPPSPALTPANATVQLLTANTQKDASASGGRFWGGASGMRLGMGGITPVHRVVLPEVSVADLLGQFGVANAGKLQENMNPLLNDATKTKQAAATMDLKTPLGFDGFADANPFTMKTLDAYRMHLWGKMAAQHHLHQQQQQLLQQQQQQQANTPAHLTGLAASMRPAFFKPTSTSSLSALLSGKHAQPAPPYTTTPSSPPPPYQSAPPSPVLGLGKSGVAEKLEQQQRERERERERERQREKEKETAMYAALASQTLLRKLGSAFWDAFSGGSGSSSGASSALGHASGSGTRAWDAEKVRRVLEGKAVVRVVDVEEPHARASMPAQAPIQAQVQAESASTSTRKCCTAAVTDILEESMRSLSLGKKA
ncbi:hypothetical protein D9615_010518 [Tricholomella constricta]|uniref:BZIP domain-containing protein n=1 Tax=Tricholomella constricta TaxID=117010 RepID=A0A8H5LSU4_9AGAR|nr:hypothetical protein D9615_010518 [Tricholomella constricta]